MTRAKSVTQIKNPHHSKIEGKPVYNTDKSLTLAIRNSDIRHAVATAPDACAAAIACVRQFHALSARVYASRTFIEYNDHWVRYVTTPALRREIVALDAGGKFHPGLYTLGKSDAPGNAATGKQTGGTKGKQNPRKDGKPRKKPMYVHTVRGRVHFGDDVPISVPSVRGEIIERS